MANINKAHRQTFCELFFSWIGSLCFLGGIVLLGCIGIQTIQDYALIAVIICGLCLLVLGCVIMLCTGIRSKSSGETRVRNALVDESSKYSTRFMLPFTWREERRDIPPQNPTDSEDSDSYVDEVSNII